MCNIVIVTNLEHTQKDKDKLNITRISLNKINYNKLFQTKWVIAFCVFVRDKSVLNC